MGTNKSKLTAADYRSAAQKVRKALLEIGLGPHIESLTVLGIAHMEAEADRLESTDLAAQMGKAYIDALHRSGLTHNTWAYLPDAQRSEIHHGMQFVEAHLHSAGRPLGADEMRLTAEQVEDVRTVVNNRPMEIYDAKERGLYYAAAARLRALFPATEPAEAKVGTVVNGLIDCQVSYTLTAEEYADFLNVIWEGRGDYSSRDRLREKFPTSEHDEARLQRKSALASSDGDCFDVCEGHPAGMTMAHIHHHEAEPPAPVEPAEGETKAETGLVADSLAYLEMSKALCDWIDADPRRSINGGTPSMLVGEAMSALGRAGMKIVASSPVVPAPTETEWPSLNDVPATVRKVKDTKGFQWVRREGDSEWLGCDGSYTVCRAGHPSNAPFVAAEEGDV